MMRKCNNLFRTIVLLLLMSIVLSSCASGATDNEDTTVSSDVTTQTVTGDRLSQLYREQEDSLPELDFEGEPIRFLTLDSSYIKNDEIWVDELNSDPFNDSIYNRNMYVMDRLNCKIENDFATAAEIEKKLDIIINSDEDYYQVIGHEAAPSLNLSLDGYFHDLNTLEEDYIDFDAPWWSRQFFDATSANDKVYVLAGSLSLSMIRSIHATYFNKRIADDEGVGDLYTVVSEGRWTIDYQSELVSGMFREMNGNDIHDDDDFYGFCTPLYWSTDSYWSAFDIEILSRDKEGRFEFVLNEEKAYDGLNKILGLCYGDGTYVEISESKKPNAMFVSGNAFMLTQRLDCVETPDFRNMKDDYGILPMPKFNENQNEYYSMPFEIFQTYSIPKTVLQPEKATAVLEALCAETWRKVIPTYSEIALKGKYLSDPESRDMFDGIISNVKMDPGIMYYIRIGNIASALYRYPIEINKPGDFTTSLEKNKRMMKVYLSELNRVAFGE